MQLTTLNGHTLDCTILRPLIRKYILVYCQDRLCIAECISLALCVEVESIDVLHYYQQYINPDRLNP